jgi:hypothetical protein
MHHLQSLLQHPLLAQNATHQTESRSAAVDAVRMMDHAMLRGEANLEMVERCMQIYIKGLQPGHAVIKDEFRLGRKISAWFMSSPPATKERFLSSPHILSNAVPILYADGQEEAVWEWLGMLYSRKPGDGSPEPPNAAKNTMPLQLVIHESHLTFLMIKEALRRRRLDAAVLQFVQACAYMQSTGRMSVEARSSQPWQAAIKAVTIALLRRRHQHGLPAQLFEDFLLQRSFWSGPDSLSFELISLYHPTHPSAKELSATVSQLKNPLQLYFDQMKVMSGPGQMIALGALLDGVQLLLKQESGSVRPARLILDFVEAQFPNLTDSKSNEATQKLIRSVRQTVTVQQLMPAPIGVT